MSITQYASGRPQLPALAAYITGSGNIQGNNQTYYFWLQGRNRVGYNFPSNSYSLVIPNNSQVGIVIPGISLLTTEDWHEFLIYVNTTNTFSSSKLVGSYRAYEVDQVTERPRGSDTPSSSDPKQIILNEDYQINFSSTVANPAALPAEPIHGMRRYVTSKNKYYFFDELSTQTVDNENILNPSNETTGRWKWLASGLLIENPTDLILSDNGCNRDINSIDESSEILLARYLVGENNNTPIKYYMKSASNGSIPKGTRISISSIINEIDVSNLLSDRLLVRIVGKVHLSDFSLDSNGFNNAYIPYNNFTKNIILEQDINANEALLISIKPEFASYDVNPSIAPYARLALYPFFDVQTSIYSETNLTQGDIIFAEYDRRYVVPYGLNNLKVLSGSGCVNLYTFRNLPEQLIQGGWSNNTANQEITITRTGNCSLLSADATHLVRSVFSTEPGYSLPCIFSSTVNISSNQNIDWNISIEKNGDYNPISNIYSDLAISNISNKAKLNTNKIALFIKHISTTNVTTIKRFIITIDPETTSVSGTISNWNAGTIINESELSTYNCNLFKPQSALIFRVTGSGSGISAGTVQIAYSFYYDGTQVSQISHDPVLGCIYTQSLQAANLGQRYLYWGEAVNTVSNLKNVDRYNRVPLQTRLVLDKARPYYFVPSSTRTPDDDLVVQPNDISGAGRWIKDDSSNWLFGSGVPSNNNGFPGDFYLRSGSLELYRKDATDTWIYLRKLTTAITTLSVTPILISGSTYNLGVAGDIGDLTINTTDRSIYQNTSGSTSWLLISRLGSIWTSSNTNPSNSAGNIGDFHINTVSGEYFQKTAPSTWTLRGTFRVVGSSWISNQGINNPGSTFADTLTDSYYNTIQSDTFGDFPPKSTTGAINDLFFNLRTSDLYQKYLIEVEGIPVPTWVRIAAKVRGCQIYGDDSNPSENTRGDVDGSGKIKAAQYIRDDLHINYATGEIFRHTGLYGGTNSWEVVGSLRHNGTIWHITNGVPDNSLGLDNDFSWDTANKKIWRKASGSWVEHSSLRPSDWLTLPQASLNSGVGKPMDFDLDPNTGYLRRKDNGNVWQFITSLRLTGTTWYTGNGAPSSTNVNHRDIYVDLDTNALYQVQPFVGLGTPPIEDPLSPGTGFEWKSIGNLGSTKIVSSTINPTADSEASINAPALTNPANASYLGVLWYNYNTHGVWHCKIRTQSGVDPYPSWYQVASLADRGFEWLIGSGVPSNSLGSIRDFYIDRLTRRLYYKEDNGTWSEQFEYRFPGWYIPGDTELDTPVIGDYKLASDGKYYRYEIVSGTPQWVFKDTLNATQIYTGTSFGSIVGTVDEGDIFINTTTGNLYRFEAPPSQSLQWVLKLSVKGSKWLTGSGDPINSQGLDDDLYFKTSDGSLWQKVSGSWSFLRLVAGSKWYSIEGVPSASSDGNIGDFTIDTLTGNYYEKTTSTVWTLRGYFRLTGNTFYFQSSDPTNDLGSDGDVCIQTTSKTMFKKISGSWVNQGVLRGSTWLTGSSNPSNGIGLNGDLYLNTTTNYYFLKSSGSWSSIGQLSGGGGGGSSNVLTGTTDPTNIEGSEGNLFFNLNTARILKKTSGTWSEYGRTNSNVLKGSGVPSNTLGLDNDFYVNTLTNEFYLKTSGSWGFIGALGSGGGGSTGALLRLVGEVYEGDDVSYFNVGDIVYSLTYDLYFQVDSNKKLVAISISNKIKSRVDIRVSSFSSMVNDSTTKITNIKSANNSLINLPVIDPSEYKNGDIFIHPLSDKRFLAHEKKWLAQTVQPSSFTQIAEPYEVDCFLSKRFNIVISGSPTIVYFPEPYGLLNGDTVEVLFPGNYYSAIEWIGDFSFDSSPTVANSDSVLFRITNIKGTYYTEIVKITPVSSTLGTTIEENILLTIPTKTSLQAQLGLTDTEFDTLKSGYTKGNRNIQALPKLGYKSGDTAYFGTRRIPNINLRTHKDSSYLENIGNYFPFTEQTLNGYKYLAPKNADNVVFAFFNDESYTDYKDITPDYVGQVFKCRGLGYYYGLKYTWTYQSGGDEYNLIATDWRDIYNVNTASVVPSIDSGYDPQNNNGLDIISFENDIDYWIATGTSIGNLVPMKYYLYNGSSSPSTITPNYRGQILVWTNPPVPTNNTSSSATNITGTTITNAYLKNSTVSSEPAFIDRVFDIPPLYVDETGSGDYALLNPKIIYYDPNSTPNDGDEIWRDASVADVLLSGAYHYTGSTYIPVSSANVYTYDDNGVVDAVGATYNLYNAGITYTKVQNPEDSVWFVKSVTVAADEIIHYRARLQTLEAEKYYVDMFTAPTLGGTLTPLVANSNLESGTYLEGTIDNTGNGSTTIYLYVRVASYNTDSQDFHFFLYNSNLTVDDLIYYPTRANTIWIATGSYEDLSSSNFVQASSNNSTCDNLIEFSYPQSEVILSCQDATGNIRTKVNPNNSGNSSYGNVFLTSNYQLLVKPNNMTTVLFGRSNSYTSTSNSSGTSEYKAQFRSLHSYPSSVGFDKSIQFNQADFNTPSSNATKFFSLGLIKYNPLIRITPHFIKQSNSFTLEDTYSAESSDIGAIIYTKFKGNYLAANPNKRDLEWMIYHKDYVSNNYPFDTPATVTTRVITNRISSYSRSGLNHTFSLDNSDVNSYYSFLLVPNSQAGTYSGTGSNQSISIPIRLPKNATASTFAGKGYYLYILKVDSGATTYETIGINLFDAVYSGSGNIWYLNGSNFTYNDSTHEVQLIGSNTLNTSGYNYFWLIL